jgi:hypothetical protein
MLGSSIWLMRWSADCRMPRAIKCPRDGERRPLQCSLMFAVPLLTARQSAQVHKTTDVSVSYSVDTKFYRTEFSNQGIIR